MSADGMFERLSDRIDASEVGAASTPFTMAELLDLPDLEMRVARLVLRAEAAMTVEQITDAIDGAPTDVAAAVGSLSLRGILDVTDDVVRMGSVRRTSRIGPGGIFGRLGDL
jgi:predicted transcriptional regulator